VFRLQRRQLAPDGSEHGAVLVEFVLILPVFLLLVFGGIDVALFVNGASEFRLGVQEASAFIADGDTSSPSDPCVATLEGQAVDPDTAETLCEVSDNIGNPTGIDLSTLQVAIVCLNSSGQVVLDGSNQPTCTFSQNPTLANTPSSFVVCARAKGRSATGLLGPLLDNMWVGGSGAAPLREDLFTPTFSYYNPNAGGPDPLVCPSTPAYTVAFDANGGGGSMSAETNSVPEPLTPEAFSPPNGDTFASWNTQPDGSGQAYTDGQDYLFQSSTTLYAQWQAA
jgi:List-Bact-rpt repeat protein/TadE-like protein